MSAGWVKLHRQMMEWEWIGNHNVYILFTKLLMIVNYKEKKWQGIVCPAGSIITSHPKLAEKVGLSLRQTRTALDKLKLTGELTVKSNNQFTMISITNWGQYQDPDEEVTHELTGKRQTDDTRPDKRMTTTKEGKEERIKENSYSPAIFDEIISHLNNKSGTKYRSNTAKTKSLIEARLQDDFCLDDFKTVINKKVLEWAGDSKMRKFLRPETLFGNKFEGYLNGCAPEKSFEEKMGDFFEEQI